MKQTKKESFFEKLSNAFSGFVGVMGTYADSMADKTSSEFWKHVYCAISAKCKKYVQDHEDWVKSHSDEWTVPAAAFDFVDVDADFAENKQDVEKLSEEPSEENVRVEENVNCDGAPSDADLMDGIDNEESSEDSETADNENAHVSLSVLEIIASPIGWIACATQSIGFLVASAIGAKNTVKAAEANA